MTTTTNDGDRGIAEAERRFGAGYFAGFLPARGTTDRAAGAAGIAEAEKRFGTDNKEQ